MCRLPKEIRPEDIYYSPITWGGVLIVKQKYGESGKGFRKLDRGFLARGSYSG